MSIRPLALWLFLLTSHLVAVAQDEFAGLKFGIGLSATSDTGGRDRVSEAQIVNGIVRVTEENNHPVRLLLESHYFIRPQSDLLGLIPRSQWGWGPFVAIQPGEGTVVDAYGMGLMIGLKRSDKAEDISSWNFGIGLILDPHVRVMADGFTPNRPPPEGETEVRYTTRSQGGILIMTSFTW